MTYNKIIEEEFTMLNLERCLEQLEIVYGEGYSLLRYYVERERVLYPNNIIGGISSHVNEF